jgi:hypothetical protein
MTSTMIPNTTAAAIKPEVSAMVSIEYFGYAVCKDLEELLQERGVGVSHSLSKYMLPD